MCTVCVLTGSVGSKQKCTSDHLGLWQVLIWDDLDCLLFQVSAGAPLKKEYTEEVRGTIMKLPEKVLGYKIKWIMENQSFSFLWLAGVQPQTWQ